MLQRGMIGVDAALRNTQLPDTSMISSTSGQRFYRYAYVKEGSTVTDLAALSSANRTSGPDVFVAEAAGLERTQLMVLASSGPILNEQDHGFQALPLRESGPGVAGRFATVKTLWRLTWRLYRFRPDRIICGCLGPVLWITFLVSKLRRVPMIHATHVRIADSTDRRLTRFRSSLDLWCLRRLQGAVCHGPYLREHLKAQGVSAANVVEFDVDLRKTLPPDTASRSEHARQTADAQVLYTGRLDEQKGVLDLLDAMAPILLDNGSLRLRYAGVGPAQERLQMEIDKLGLQDQVVLLGALAHDQLLALAAQATVIVTPTQRRFPEGRCMSAVEALLLGVPVIAPDYGPFPFAVQHEQNGLLFEPNSINDLRSKIEELLEDSDLYSRVRRGAESSSDSLFSSELTFAQAIEAAFSTPLHST